MVLADRYAGVVLDIDGVLCRGDTPLPCAAAALDGLRARGIRIALLTNNASRTRAQAVSWLAGMGLTVAPEEIISSPMAAAALLEPGTRCLVIGMDGLREALAERPVDVVTEPEDAAAVVVGFDRGLTWDDLRRATLALRAGARFIGTNADATFPSPEGLWPGNGAVLAALTTASDRHPEIAGKPEPALFETAAAHLGVTPLLMVGDRIETDIAGAAALGWDTALVLSGVTDAAASASADATHVLDDIGGLVLDHAPAQGMGRPVRG